MNQMVPIYLGVSYGDFLKIMDGKQNGHQTCLVNDWDPLVNNCTFLIA